MSTLHWFDIRNPLTFKVERRAIWSRYTLCPWRNQRLICHKNLKANGTKADLPQCPKLAQYLSHCARERTYFVSIKKCGSQECNICKPLRLNDHDFQRLDHIPDPTPDDAMHYKRFSEVFRTQTMKAAMPSSKTSKDCGSKVPFNVVKQHATNTGITIECGECSKPRLLSIS